MPIFLSHFVLFFLDHLYFFVCVRVPQKEKKNTLHIFENMQRKTYTHSRNIVQLNRIFIWKVNYVCENKS